MATLGRGRAALCYGLAFVLYAIWQFQPASLHVYQYDYDEGVHLQTAWALARGYELYSDIFCAQPPLIPYLLSSLFQFTGPSVAGARVIIILLSLGGLIGSALVAARARGWVAGLAAVAILSLHHEYLLNARTITPEVPAIALGTLALGLVMIGKRHQPVWLVAAGMAVALASLAKLSALLFMPTIAVAILLRERRRLFRAVRNNMLVALPSLLLWALMALTIDIAPAVDQLITFRSRAREIYPVDVSGNLAQIWEVIGGHPASLLLALIGLGSLIQRRQWQILAPLVVLILSIIGVSLTYSPLFPHHAVLLLPPITMLGGIGLVSLLHVLWERRQVRLQALRQPVVLGAVGGLLLLIALVPGTLALTLRRMPDVSRSWERVQAPVAALESLPDGELVITDDQMAAFVAGNPVPPSLADTSFVRIRSGVLVGAMAIDEVFLNQPAAVLFWTGRLDRLPDFRDWVKQNYHRKADFGEDGDLFLRDAPG